MCDEIDILSLTLNSLLVIDRSNLIRIKSTTSFNFSEKHYLHFIYPKTLHTPDNSRKSILQVVCST